ncbi:DUF4365 domain-containing protein [Spirobacillus cienkowskii]|uniref:DUF4365 domain-containing protein n=1 Tax=Spirobacillus cienkowskii TaxID=495820 RepID=UPI0030CAADA9
MTISLNETEAELSYAYLHAVASQAGFTCSYSNRLEDSYRIVDARVGAGIKPDPLSVLEDFEIEIQLKATSQELITNTKKISYPFKGIKQYNKLRSENTGGRKFLILLQLPKNHEDWLYISEEQLLLKGVAYWVSLRGAPPSKNDTIQTIYIPTENVLTVQSLKDLMIRISKKEDIKYEL